jgi:hypothetical protein
MNDGLAADGFPGLTDIHAHPAMNSFLWDRDLRRHYWTGRTFNPLASLSDFRMLEKGGVKVLWSSLHVPEREFFRCWLLRIAAHLTGGGRKLLKLSAWQCLLVSRCGSLPNGSRSTTFGTPELTFPSLHLPFPTPTPDPTHPPFPALLVSHSLPLLHPPPYRSVPRSLTTRSNR